MISAQIGEHVVTKPCNRAVVFAPDFHRADLRAAMNRRLHVLAARFDPLNWLAELDRDPAKQGFLCVNVELRSKAAANFRCDHAQLVLRNADHQSQLRPQQVRNLS